MNSSDTGTLCQVGATPRRSATTHWVGVGVEGKEDREAEVLTLERPVVRALVDSYWHSRERLDRLLIAIHIVVSRAALGDTVNGYSPISTRLLARAIGRDFAGRALQTLTEVGILETDRKYTPGVKCTGYRIGRQFASQTLAPVLVNRRLGAHLAQRRIDAAKSAVGDYRPHQLLWRNLQQLELPSNCLQLMPNANAGDPGSAAKRHAWILSASAVLRREWFFAVGGRSHRVFNNFTSLPKAIRSVALLGGRNCAEIDIRNSQPFFLASTYPDRGKEAAKYLDIVTAGEFYEQLNIASGSLFKPDERDQLKSAVFTQVLYGRFWGESPLWRGFEKLFPQLASEIARRKSKDYRQISIDMQLAESNAMIAKLVPAVASIMPECAFLTVHDSLAVPLEFAEQAAELLISSVQSATGNRPAVRISSRDSALH